RNGMDSAEPALLRLARAPALRDADKTLRGRCPETGAKPRHKRRRMNKAIFVGLPVVVLGAAAAAIPWYAGSQYERAVRAQVSELSRLPQLPLNVTLVRYSRGWLSSEAVVRFTLKAQPSLFLDLRQRISQWPDPNSGWLRVHSLPEWSGPVKAALD